MDRKTAAQYDDIEFELLRAVNCFTTPAEFSARNWDMWKRYSDWYLNHIKRTLCGRMADDGLAYRLRLLSLRSEEKSRANSATESETILLLGKVATSLCEGKTSLSDISSAVSPTSGEHIHGIDYTTDSFESFQEDQDLLDVQQSHKCQVVFVLLSSILLLYTPTPSPQPLHLRLQLRDPEDEEKALRSNSLRKLSCLLTADVAALSFEHLLNCFGHLKFQPISESSQDHKPIISSNFNYYILFKVTGIRVVWVDCLSLHLEFDRRTMTLKLFRFPSFCAMLAIPRESKATIFDRHVFSAKLSRLFAVPWRLTRNHSVFQSQKADFESYNTRAQNTSPYSQDFFVEVLCSYRILFSQQKKARDLYLKHFQASSSQQADHEVDPLRDDICGTPAHKNILFDQIEAFPEKSTYWSDSDFPNLGDRLLEIQDFVESHDAGTLRALWYDVRDLNRFWTFWTVVVFGVTSIFLSMIQTVLAGLQLRC